MEMVLNSNVWLHLLTVYVLCVQNPEFIPISDFTENYWYCYGTHPNFNSLLEKLRTFDGRFDVLVLFMFGILI